MNKRFKEECIKRFHYLDSIYDGETPEGQEKIKRTYYALQDLMDIYNPSKATKKAKRSLKETLLREKQFLQQNKKAIKLIEPLAVSNTIVLGDEPANVYLPEETRFELIHDFFREVLDKELFEVFMYIFNNKKYFFHHYKSNEERKNLEVFLEYFQEPHILLNRYGTLQEVYISCHEIGHGIIELYNPSYNNNSNNVFDEIISMFFEYLCLDFLKSFEKFAANSTDVLQDDFDYYSDASLTIIYQLELIKRCNFI